MIALGGRRFLVIYGDDSRYDVVDIHDSVRQAAISESARSVAAVFRSESLRSTAVGVDLESRLAAEKFGLVSGARFREQHTAALGTAFVVGERHVLTAGHCISKGNQAKRRFVFGYCVDSKGTTPLSVPKEWVYEPQEVVGRVHHTQGADWALVKVDRKIDRPPLRRRTRPVEQGESVYYIGYPWGLPIKYAGHAVVLDAGSGAFFKANLDTFTGASGSPVFDVDHNVVGLHVRGIEQSIYVEQEGGWDERRVELGKGDATGEEITKITEIPLDGI